MLESFEQFLREKHPDICMACWGQGVGEFKGADKMKPDELEKKMRHPRGIEDIWIGWKNCGWKEKWFHVGGGSYQDFSYPKYWHIMRHFYFSKWCFFSIKFVWRAL